MKLDQQITVMTDDINELKSDVKDIRDALLGDEFNPGFKQRIGEVESRALFNSRHLHKLRNYYVAAVSIFGFLSAALLLLTKLNII